MDRIDSMFDRLRQANRKAFIPYVTAGDPTLEKTIEIVVALERSGADLIELGVPFSDPLADGPTIQAASQRALKHRVSLGKVFDAVTELRKQTQIPVILFTYFNPVFKYGLERFADSALDSGVDGSLVLDLPPEEAEEYMALMSDRGLATVFLLAPTSSDDRIELVCKCSTGFVYYVSRTGVTGVRDKVEEAVKPVVDKIRSFTSKPIAVGFGISTRSQAHEVAQYADAVVVGSAIVQVIGDHGEGPGLIPAVSALAEELTAGVKAKR
jgi:tryptophan synthase alpha chain